MQVFLILLSFSTFVYSAAPDMLSYTTLAYNLIPIPGVAQVMTVVNFMFEHYIKASEPSAMQIVEQQINKFANELIRGEYVAFNNTANELKQSVNVWENNKNNSNVIQTLKIRNELTIKHARDLTDKIIALGNRIAKEEKTIGLAFAMTSFMYCGLVADTIKYGKEWGYHQDNLMNYQENLFQRADYLYKQMLKYQSSPWTIEIIQAKSSVMYFRRQYSNVYVNKPPIYTAINKDMLQQGQQNIFSGSFFQTNPSHSGYFGGVAYSEPAVINANTPVKKKIRSGAYTLQIRAIVSEEGVGSHYSGGYMQINNKTFDLWNNPTIEQFNKKRADNINELKYISLGEVGVNGDFEIGIYGKQSDESLMLYHLEFVVKSSDFGGTCVDDKSCKTGLKCLQANKGKACLKFPASLDQCKTRYVVGKSRKPIANTACVNETLPASSPDQCCYGYGISTPKDGTCQLLCGPRCFLNKCV